MSEYSEDANRTPVQRMVRALNRLGKWRRVFTGRLIGTRPISDPRAQGYGDLFEKLLILRAEVTALTGVLFDKGLVTHDEFCDRIAKEARLLSREYEATFPGMRATDDGIVMDARARETMKGWPP